MNTQTSHNTGVYIAAVDMGTNSFHMIIAETTPLGAFRIIDRMKHWVRLGDGVDAKGRLDEAAITRMIESLGFFKKLAESYNAEIHYIATSAMRDAPNRHAIARRIFQTLGLVVDIVSGEEEARIVFQGVRSENYISDKQAFVIDIGGGSTEVMVGNHDGLMAAESLDMGARRYSRLFFADNHYTKQTLKKCSNAAASKIQAVSNAFKDFEIHAVYGTSGTIKTLADFTASLLEKSDTSQLFLEDLKSTRAALLAAVEQDTLPASVEAERKQTLVAGAIILEEVMSALGIHALRVCSSALREGIIYDRMESSGRLPARPIQASANAMVSRFNLDHEQICRVTTTAGIIFSAYAQAFDLNEEANRLLLAACKLHDVGLAISHKKIHLHGYYMIANANMTGITQRQQHMLANIVRYHRKAAPNVRDADLKIMRPQDMKTTIMLAAILRLASALNRTKSGAAAEMRIVVYKEEWHWIFDHSDWLNTHEICIWKANQEKRPLSKILGKPILIQGHDKLA